MRRFERNTLLDTKDFLIKVDSPYITFERYWLDNAKRFFRLPYYELVTIYTDVERSDVEECYLTKVYPKINKTFVF